MKFRLAKESDLDQITDIVFETRFVNSNGIFAQMGKSFLNAYYKIAINNKHSVFLCAEDDYNKIQGIAFSILDSERFDIEVKRKKIWLLLGAISSIIRNPKLIISLMKRYRSLKSRDNSYVHNSGPRGCFWGWAPLNKDSLSSFELHERMLAVISSLGQNELYFEVDKSNKNVYKFHKLNGAELIKEIMLDDLRVRYLMKYDLTKHKYNLL